MNILFVDDSKAVHSFFRDVISVLGHSMHDAYTGEQGVEVVLASKPGFFDLIFMDWEMPGITGYEALQIIRASGRTEPVFMMTSKNSLQDIQQCIEAGANDYLMKPVTKDIMIQKIQDLRKASQV